MVGRLSGRALADEPARGLGDRREDVLVLLEAGHAHQAVLGLAPDHVDDVVDGDAADQVVVLVDNGRRDQVELLEALRDLRVGRMRLMAAPRKMPSMAGFALEVPSYVQR